MREVVIAAAARTPIGSFNGSLSSVSAVELGQVVIEAVLARSGVGADKVDEVIMGQILQSGSGQNPARQSAIRAGLPDTAPAYTINKLCGSGLKSISLAAMMIATGEADIVVAGGMENMTQAPYLLDKARNGYRLGNGIIEDSIIKDALTDAFFNIHMGVTAENIAKRYNISREEADVFAFNSQQKTVKAIADGKFQDEIVPVPIKQRKGDPTLFYTDEYPKKDTTLENLTKLRPAFDKEGVVTAGNASGVNDGAAAVLLMSRKQAEQSGISPLGSIKSSASIALDPKVMGLGPVGAIRKALEKAGLSIDDIELFELNEAFATQSIGVIKELGLDLSKVNVNGGAISLGHPVGASGARVLVTLLYEMKKRDLRFGVAALCIGGGQGIAMVIER